MKKIVRTIIVLSVIVLSLGLSACGSSKKAEKSSEKSAEKKSKIRLGVVGENNEQWEPVIKKLKSQGITLELVKFSEYSMPNQALVDGEIDLNAFQHYAYLEDEIAGKKFDLTVIGETVIAPLGIYSEKVSQISEITSGAKIAIPSDATNGGRAIKLIEAAGLIEVDPATGYTPTLNDITKNSLNIEFYEVEAGNTSSLLPDVTASVINGGHAVDNGLSPEKDALYLEGVQEGGENPYINVIVARTEEKDNENYRKLVEVYQSEEVKQVINEAYKGAYLPAWE